MDIEKYTGGKVFMFFEWAFKLIIWNLLALGIILIVAGGPLYGFFYVQEEHAVTEINIVDNNVDVTLKNGIQGEVGNFIEYGSITSFEIDDNRIYLKMEEKTIKVNNEDRIRNIENLDFDENGELIATYMGKTSSFGNIYDGEIDLPNSYVDSYGNFVLVLDNGTNINFGTTLDVDISWSGILVLISIVLAIFAFIPCYVTIFSVIKIFGESRNSGTFILFFDRLWDNFKSLYKIEIVLVPVVSLMCFSLYIYYNIIQSLETINFFFSFSYNIILVCLIGILIFILNLPFTLGYFRMKTKSILRFTLTMSLKNILYSIIYVALLVLPILACFLNNIFIPFWFLLGLSLPLFVEYFITFKKYRYLVNNLNDYTKDDTYDLQEENNEIRD